MKAAQTLDQLTQTNIKTIHEIERMMENKEGKSDRISEHIATRIGTWSFIVSQACIVGLWIAGNLLTKQHRWDPYPFVFLNLALSIQAAFSGPIIIMSQNRRSRMDQRRHELDLQINLLAEQENTEMLRMLRQLCDKAGIKHGNDSLGDALCEATRATDLATQIQESREFSDGVK